MSSTQQLPNAPGAIAALVVGILGLIMCPLAGPIAWVLGQSAEREVDASGGTLGGRGVATAGKILGIIATVLLALGVVFLVLVYVVLRVGP